MAIKSFCGAPGHLRALWMGGLSVFSSRGSCSLVTVGQTPTGGATDGLETIALDTGRLFVPSTLSADRDRIDLLIHSHGDPTLVARSFQAARMDGALLVINYPGLSSAYRRPFENRALFGRILGDAISALRRQSLVSPKARWNHVCVSCFSAGFGAVREILKCPEYFARVDGLLCADSIYAGLVAGSDRRQVEPKHMRDFCRYARQAAAGKKTFVVTHSYLHTPKYASTEETAGTGSPGRMRDAGSRIACSGIARILYNGETSGDDAAPRVSALSYHAHGSRHKTSLNGSRGPAPFLAADAASDGWTATRKVLLEMNNSMKRTTNRRQFLGRASAGVAAPLIVPATVLGRDPARPAPSERITMACVGVGGRGRANLRAFKGKKQVQIVAVCDVDTEHLAAGLRDAGLRAEAGCGDFREIVSRGDIDTVMVGTPDHWHALIAIAAAAAGKDVYCEKPLAASIAEGQALVRAVERHGRILQCGSQRRSMAGCRFACELVRNGRIGRVRQVEVGVRGRFAIRGGFTGLEAPQPVPENFDYQTWLGPCPVAPYTAARCHFNFRWVLDYAPGYITDWGAHYLDIAQWGLGTDESGPVAVDAQNVRFRDKGIYDAPEGFRIVYSYASGAKIILLATEDRSKWGIKFVGDEGSVYVESHKVVTDPASITTTTIREDEIHLYDARNDHHGNFLDCVRSRKRPSAPVRIAHRSASICHIGAISCTLGRKLKWDPEKEQFVGDDQANRRLTRPMRAPWTLPRV